MGYRLAAVKGVYISSRFEQISKRAANLPSTLFCSVLVRFMPISAIQVLVDRLGTSRDLFQKNNYELPATSSQKCTKCLRLIADHSLRTAESSRTSATFSSITILKIGTEVSHHFSPEKSNKISPTSSISASDSDASECARYCADVETCSRYALPERKKGMG